MLREVALWSDRAEMWRRRQNIDGGAYVSIWIWE